MPDNNLNQITAPLLAAVSRIKTINAKADESTAAGVAALRNYGPSTAAVLDAVSAAAIAAQTRDPARANTRASVLDVLRIAKGDIDSGISRIVERYGDTKAGALAGVVAAGMITGADAEDTARKAVGIQGAGGKLALALYDLLPKAGSQIIRLPTISPMPAAPPTSALLSSAAVGAQPHLLVLSTSKGGQYFFGLSSAAYSSLKRQTSYGIASQDRLTRRPALQAVGKGTDKLSLSGAIFTAGPAGGKQLSQLRGIGFATEPVMLTTGYGEVLGRWFLMSVEEEQDGLMADGAPRKQTFTLEFERYGDDFAND